MPLRQLPPTARRLGYTTNLIESLNAELRNASRNRGRVAWLLAKLFFGAVYAAVSKMVQHTEDLQSTQMPILLLIMATAYIPGFGWMNTATTWIQVMSCDRG